MARIWSDHRRKPPVVPVALLAFLAGAVSLIPLHAICYTSDPDVIVRRHFGTITVAEGDTIDVMFAVVNNGKDALEGFLISEQLPNEMIVIARSVEIGGTKVKDHVYEVDEPDSVYDDATATRFVLETPSLFPEENPIPPGETATIVYTFLCPYAGVFTFKNFAWAGRWDIDPDTFEVFGYDDTSPTVTVTGPANVSISLVPDDVIVPRGTKLGFTVTLTNNTGSSVTIDGWNDIYLSSGSAYTGNPVFGPKAVPLGPHKERVKHLNQKIPSNAPLGVYAYCSRVGEYGGSIIDADGFLFRVVEEESVWTEHLNHDAFCSDASEQASN